MFDDERANAGIKNALAEAQSDVRHFDAERKEAAQRARKAEMAAKVSGTAKIDDSYRLLCWFAAEQSAVAMHTSPPRSSRPQNFQKEAAAAFKQYAPEYRRVVELAVQNERDKLNAEREHLAAERNRIRDFDDETMWDKIVSYGWLVLIFAGGFVVGGITIVVAFIFHIR